MRESNIWDPLAVKQQTFKTAIESACMLLRIDDIVSGIKKERPNATASRGDDEGEQEGFGDQRDG
jgi:T-complex protein 1 subunit gamma